MLLIRLRKDEGEWHLQGVGGSQILNIIPIFAAALSVYLKPLPMSPKVKGLFKGLKYISQIFAYKKQEMEIGHPTDVRHVAHIGFGCDSTHAPSWMSQFKSASDITPSSLNGFNSPSLNEFDFKQPRRCQSVSSSGNSMSGARPEIPKPSKKKKRKKANVSSLATSMSSSSRSSFSAAFEEPAGTPNRERPNQLQGVISEPVCV